jgi:hypothetical protein
MNDKQYIAIAMAGVNPSHRAINDKTRATPNFVYWGIAVVIVAATFAEFL